MEIRWLYALFLAMDANFRCRRLNVSSEELDPGLVKGYGYFVRNNDYVEHLASYSKAFADEHSTCNNFDAIKLANSRGGPGIAASGLAACGCSRHDMRRPNSVADLHKGEQCVSTSISGFKAPN